MASATAMVTMATVAVRKRMDKVSVFLILIVSVIVPVHSVKAQTVIGTPGLMNVTTAEIRDAGTFDGGASFMERELQAAPMYYNTGLYYINFAPFSFFDVTFRETLIKCGKSATNPKVGFYQQDRSLSLRVRPVKEKEGKWWPSVLVGANDFYSDTGDSYYTAVYGVVTKTLPLKGIGVMSATAGYAKPFRMGVLYDGMFGGVSFSPAFAPTVRLMGEYDTRHYNVGIGARLFRHLNLTFFTCEFKGISATMSYQYTIRF